jgi:hypothetical protein
MGILTNISYEYDDDKQELRIYAVTRFAPSQRSSINRVAGRAVVGHPDLGQRTLVAAANEELGLDLVWSEGPFGSKPIEEKYPDSQKIEFSSNEIEHTSDFGEVLTARLQDRVDFGEFRKGSVLNIWTVPYEVMGITSGM